MSEAEEPGSLIPVWSFLRTLYSYWIRILLEESKLKDMLMEVQAREGQWAEAYRKVRRSKCACTEICLPHSCHMKLTQTPCICFSILCTFFKSLLMTLGKVPFTLIFHSSNAPSSLKSFPKYYLLIETYYHNKNNWHYWTGNLCSQVKTRDWWPHIIVTTTPLSQSHICTMTVFHLGCLLF